MKVTSALRLFIFTMLVLPATYSVLAQAWNPDAKHAEDGAKPAEGAVQSSLFKEIVGAINRKDLAGCMQGESFSQTISNKKAGTSKTSKRDVDSMPAGYFYGMMVNFAKNSCLVKTSGAQPLSKFEGILGGSTSTSRPGDVIKYYGNNSVLKSTDNPLVQNYALMLPLGMIESSGVYTEGRDKSASNNQPTTAEAGLFQVSYNSVGGIVPRDVYRQLMTTYKDGTDKALCMNSLFDGGKNRQPKPGVGNGEGRKFQEAMLNCPALAADYMALVTRANHEHNGPYNRHEAKPRQSCIASLEAVDSVVRAGGSGFCENLAKVSPSDFDPSLYKEAVGDPEVQKILGNRLNTGSMSFDPSTGSVEWKDDQGQVIAGDSGQLYDPKDKKLAEAANADLYDSLAKQKAKLDEKRDEVKTAFDSMGDVPEDRGERGALKAKLTELTDRSNEIGEQVKSLSLLRAKIRQLDAKLYSARTKEEEAPIKAEIADLIRQIAEIKAQMKAK